MQNVEAQYDPLSKASLGIQEQNYQTELKIREFLQRENIEKNDQPFRATSDEQVKGPFSMVLTA
ncbi:MAG: hypothetical protein R2861_04575 [Desulfobacterales bacterium]